MRFDLFGGYNVYNYGFKGTDGFKVRLYRTTQASGFGHASLAWGALSSWSVELKREDRADYYYRRASTQPTDMNV